MSRRPRVAIALGAVLALALPLLPVVASPALADESYAAGRYIVQLVGDAVATASGDQDFDPHSADAQREVTRTERLQDRVAATAGVDIESNLSLTLNAFTATLSAAEATRLAADPRVARLVPDDVLVADAVTPDETFELTGAGGLWESVGGVENAGAGVVVGVIDSGVAPENPAFAGEALGTTAGAQPYLDGNTVVFDKADGEQFRAERVADVAGSWSSDAYSTTLIGARWFGDGAVAGGFKHWLEADSPRDVHGHGSHVASTIVARENTVIDDSGRTMSGVAPAAKLAVYKACFLGNDGTGNSYCSFADTLSAIDAAVADGVDVINYSISGGTSAVPDVFAEAARGAAAAGIFIAASAGNSGPTVSTVAHVAPWITSVAAANATSMTARATVGEVTVTGVTDGFAEPVTAPVVRSSWVPASAGVDSSLCRPGELGDVTGKIVVCDRGISDRVEKARVVAAAGGVAMVLLNVSVTNDNLVRDQDTAVPMMQVTYADSQKLIAALGDGSVDHVMDISTHHRGDASIASFSSRGPALGAATNLLKPDLAAPGVNIQAAIASAQGAPPAFGPMSGTSMASPHVAGLGAVYLSQHPQATSAEIKSALMTTATPLRTDYGVDESAFADGAGMVDETTFLDPGLVYLNGPSDWASYLAGIGVATGAEPMETSDLNLASIAVDGLNGTRIITRTVTALTAGEYSAALTVPGVTATVTPSVLTLAAGESATVAIQLTATSLSTTAWAQGSLAWTSATHRVTSPVVVRGTATDVRVTPVVHVDGVAGTEALTVGSGADLSAAIETAGLIKAVKLVNPNTPDDPDGPSGYVDVDDDNEWVFQKTSSVATPVIVEAHASDPGARLRVSLYRRTGNSWTSVGSGNYTSSTTAVSTLVAWNTQPALYRINATWSTGFEGGTFDVFRADFDRGESIGSLNAAPSVLQVPGGSRATHNVSWAELPTPGSYWGTVQYRDALAGVVVAQTGVHVTVPEPSATPSPTPTDTESPSPSPSPTDTGSPSPSPTDTESPSPSPSPSDTESSSPSPSPSGTGSPSPSPTDTESPSPSPSPSDTESPSPSPSPTGTPSPSPTPSDSSSPSPGVSPTPTPSVSPTPTPSVTGTPSASPTPSVSPIPSATPSVTPTPSATPPVTPTPSATPPVTPTTSATSAPTFPSVVVPPSPRPTPSTGGGATVPPPVVDDGPDAPLNLAGRDTPRGFSQVLPWNQEEAPKTPAKATPTPSPTSTPVPVRETATPSPQDDAATAEAAPPAEDSTPAPFPLAITMAIVIGGVLIGGSATAFMLIRRRRGV